MTEDNEKLVRAFYEATVPGDRESLSALQSVHVICEVPEGMSTGGEGMMDRLEHFLLEFCAAFGVHFVAEEFITMTSASSRSVISKEKRKGVRANRCALRPRLDSPG